MLNFISFGSGSSGNCYLLYTESDALLIDLGKKIGPKTAEVIRTMPDILRVRVIYTD